MRSGDTMEKKTWTRAGLLVGLLAIALVSVRLGRTLGHAGGGDDEGGCSAPQAVGEERTPAASAQPARLASHVRVPPRRYRVPGLALLHAHPRFGGAHAVPGVVPATHRPSIVAHEARRP